MYSKWAVWEKATVFSEVWFSPVRWSWWATVRWGVEVTCAAAALWRTGTPEHGGWAPEADADSPPDALNTQTNFSAAAQWTCGKICRLINHVTYQVDPDAVNMMSISGNYYQCSLSIVVGNLSEWRCNCCNIQCLYTALVHEQHMCVLFTLYVWQVFLVLVHFTAVDGESQAFEQHGSLLQLSVSVGEQTQRAALGYSHPGWRETQLLLVDAEFIIGLSASL